MKDPRFEHANYDPKFIKPNKSKNKVQLSERFKSVLTDPKFHMGTDYDKYGNKNKKTAQ